MLEVKRNHAKPPSGGHRFPAGSGSFVRGDTVEEVLEKMEVYCAENALPLNDPEEDLAYYYLKIAKYLVRVVEGERFKLPSQIIAEAIMALWKSHPKGMPSDSPIPALRAKTCESCEMRREFPSDLGSSRPYVKTATRRAKMLTGDRNFLSGHFCNACKLPLDLINRVKAPELLQSAPKSCWITSI
jgi:hypothetical protein